MKIAWYGTAMLMVEEENTRVLLDPYLKPYAKKLPPVPVEEAKTADAIFVTHSHFDHIADAPTFNDDGRKPVYTSANGIERMRKHGVDVSGYESVAPGDEIITGDVKTTVYQSRHCRFDIPTVLRVLFSPKTPLLLPRAVKIYRTHRSFPITSDIFAYEISGTDKKIMVFGSAGIDACTEYPVGADLLVLAYQGRRDLHRKTMEIIGRIRPKAVMLTHFDASYPPVTTTMNTQKFLENAKKNFPGMHAFIPTEKTWYEV